MYAGMEQINTSHSRSLRKALEAICLEAARSRMVIRWERKVFDFLKNLSQTPGHGTSWGTNFAGGVGKWKPKKKGVSKKMLGLGVGAGFLGGAALGVAGTMASYSVYHKYQVDIIHFQCLQHPKLRPESKYFRWQFFYTLSLYVAMKNTQGSTYCIMLLQDEGGGSWAV